MSKKAFYILFGSVLVLSAAITFAFGCDDKISFFITCVGSLATLATLYVAYGIFISYSSPADIQKRKFDLVDKALTLFITKRFFGTSATQTYFLYLTKQRLGTLKMGLEESKQTDKIVVISKDFFEFLSDFQSQLENHYFPFDLKKIILSNIPPGIGMLSSREESLDKVKIAIKADTEEYGYIYEHGKPININTFIERMNIIRITMINYLNKKVPKKDKIIDDNI